MNDHDNHKCAVAGAHIHPEDFGAVGDGVTDDSDAFQRAIDAVGDDGYIALGDATYHVRKPLKMNGYELGGGEHATIAKSKDF